MILLRNHYYHIYELISKQWLYILFSKQLCNEENQCVLWLSMKTPNLRWNQPVWFSGYWLEIIFTRTCLTITAINTLWSYNEDNKCIILLAFKICVYTFCSSSGFVYFVAYEECAYTFCSSSDFLFIFYLVAFQKCAKSFCSNWKLVCLWLFIIITRDNYLVSLYEILSVIYYAVDFSQLLNLYHI